MSVAFFPRDVDKESDDDMDEDDGDDGGVDGGRLRRHLVIIFEDVMFGDVEADERRGEHEKGESQERLEGF